MGSLATGLAKSGFEVSGSDENLYEPMKSQIEESAVRFISGYHKETLSLVKPDVVIIGNVLRKENPEAGAWIRSGVKFLSFPEAIRTFLIDGRQSVVCAGTHGKTTITSFVSFLLSELGKNPSFMIGGIPKNIPTCAVTTGDFFVGEGDEYDSAFFDKGPKYLHYDPKYLILSNIEFDHADIFRDLDHIRAAFRKLIALLPGDGICVANLADPVVRELIQDCLCPVQTFGNVPTAMWQVTNATETESGYEFEVLYKRRSLGKFRTPLMGEYNIQNLLAGLILVVNLGISIDAVRPLVEKFEGVKRRQEILLKSPVVLIDDFAHHPTEVKATVSGVRKRYPNGKLWAVFEPRSATARRNYHQESYGKAFEGADEVLLCAPYRASELSADQALSTDQIVAEIKKAGKAATSFPNAQAILDCLISRHTPGDIVLVMSNGEFDKIQEKLLEQLSRA